MLNKIIKGSAHSETVKAAVQKNCNLRDEQKFCQPFIFLAEHLEILSRESLTARKKNFIQKGLESQILKEFRLEKTPGISAGDKKNLRLQSHFLRKKALQGKKTF